MNFLPTALPGVLLVEADVHADERGTFTRVFCRETFIAQGLVPPDDQWSLSFNPRRGTLRGLHYQAAPRGETKLVRCARGRSFHVALDIRPDSAAFGRHFAVELRSDRPQMLYVPEGFAHGFLTLDAETEIVYGIAPGYVAGGERGVCWNDPDLGIAWPFPPTVISERDARLPGLRA